MTFFMVCFILICVYTSIVLHLKFILVRVMFDVTNNGGQIDVCLNIIYSMLNKWV